jgi:hypothetical protein
MKTAFHSRTSVAALFVYICITSLVASQTLLMQIQLKRQNTTNSELRPFATHANVADSNIWTPYLPGIYPQTPNAHIFEHDTTWYATSAFIDERPRFYGSPPSIAVVAGGPVDEVLTGVTWLARVHTLRTGAVVMDIECEKTYFTYAVDQQASKHAAATIFCPTSEQAWGHILSLNENVGICLIRNATQFCNVGAIVPVSRPMASSRLLYRKDMGSGRTVSPARSVLLARKRHISGNGPIAMCVPGVQGDGYADDLMFFLQYYKGLGVDTAFVYMHNPGSIFASVAESIVDMQTRGSMVELSTLILIPWCVQLGASYLCDRHRTVAPLSGYFDFVGSNHGQLLAQQDCLFRAMDAHRWVLFIDFDEFIVPRKNTMHTLHDIVRDQASQHGVAPAEVAFQSAFYEPCRTLPADQKARLKGLPWQAQSALRVSRFYPQWFRTKYMCDPMSCDRITVHYIASLLCERFQHHAISGGWQPSCNRSLVPHSVAAIHHTRKQYKLHDCVDIVNHTHVLDWSMAEYVQGQRQRRKSADISALEETVTRRKDLYHWQPQIPKFSFNGDVVATHSI